MAVPLETLKEHGINPGELLILVKGSRFVLISCAKSINVYRLYHSWGFSVDKLLLPRM